MADHRPRRLQNPAIARPSNSDLDNKMVPTSERFHRVQNSQGGNLYCCSLEGCSFTRETREKVMNHYATSHLVKPHLCEECDQRQLTGDIVKHFKAAHTLGKAYACGCTRASYLKEKLLDQHKENWCPERANRPSGSREWDFGRKVFKGLISAQRPLPTLPSSPRSVPPESPRPNPFASPAKPREDPTSCDYFPCFSPPHLVSQQNITQPDPYQFLDSSNLSSKPSINSDGFEHRPSSTEYPSSTPKQEVPTLLDLETGVYRGATFSFAISLCPSPDRSYFPVYRRPSPSRPSVSNTQLAYPPPGRDSSSTSVEASAPPNEDIFQFVTFPEEEDSDSEKPTRTSSSSSLYTNPSNLVGERGAEEREIEVSNERSD